MYPPAIFRPLCFETRSSSSSLPSHNDQFEIDRRVESAHQQSIHSFIGIGATEITHRHPHQPQTIAKMPAADVGAAIWENKKRSVRRRLLYLTLVTVFIFADELIGLLTTTKEAVDIAGQPLGAQDLGDTIIVAENPDETKAGDDSDVSQAGPTKKGAISIEDVSVSIAVFLFKTTSIFL
jgi:hypothetical protein